MTHEQTYGGEALRFRPDACGLLRLVNVTGIKTRRDQKAGVPTDRLEVDGVFYTLVDRRRRSLIVPRRVFVDLESIHGRLTSLILMFGRSG